MGIKEQEDAWFAELRKEHPSAVADGVVDEKEYLQTTPKIVFILKEVNGGAGWDLREFLQGGGRAQTWNNITRWTKGLIEPETANDWNEYRYISPEQREQYLRKIVTVNLKKIPGGSVSDGREIYKHGSANLDFIEKQLRLYEPDLAICCGTGGALYEMWHGDDDAEWESTSNDIWYFRHDCVPFISYKHPAARMKADRLFYELMSAVKECIE